MKKADYERTMREAWALAGQYRRGQHSARSVSDDLIEQGKEADADVALAISEDERCRAEGAEAVIRLIQRQLGYPTAKT